MGMLAPDSLRLIRATLASVEQRRVSKMSSKVAKLAATVVAVPLYLGLWALALGGIQRELGAPPGTQFPYGLLLILTMVPLLMAIWSSEASISRRTGAWAIGTTVTIGSLLMLRPVALKAYAWEALYAIPSPLPRSGLWPVQRLEPCCLESYRRDGSFGQNDLQVGQAKQAPPSRS